MTRDCGATPLAAMPPFDMTGMNSLTTRSSNGPSGTRAFSRGRLHTRKRSHSGGLQRTI